MTDQVRLSEIKKTEENNCTQNHLVDHSNLGLGKIVFTAMFRSLQLGI